MFKLMGIFLAVIGSGAVGFYKAEEFKQRRSLLMDFRQMILHIASEISYFKEPLPQIFEKLSGGDERKSHVFLRQCNLSYRQTGVNLSDIWQASVDYVYAKQPLTEDDKKLMKRCADFLGQSDYKGQQEHFALLNAELDRQIAHAGQICNSKGRMYRKMGMAVGLIIAVVLL